MRNITRGKGDVIKKTYKGHSSLSNETPGVNPLNPYV